MDVTVIQSFSGSVTGQMSQKYAYETLVGSLPGSDIYFL